MYNYNIDPKKGKKIFSMFEDKKKKDKNKIKVFNENETNNLDTINISKKDIIVKIKIILNMNVLEMKKDNKTGNDSLINKETGEKIRVVIKKIINSNKIIFLDKKKLKKQKTKRINPETWVENFIQIKPKLKEKIDNIL